jgi:hypothetical protein
LLEFIYSKKNGLLDPYRGDFLWLVIQPARIMVVESGNEMGEVIDQNPVRGLCGESNETDILSKTNNLTYIY